MKPDKSETIVKELFAQAGITIDGHESYDLQVHKKQFYLRVVRDGSLGFGETYMDGWWDCDALDQLIDRVSRADLVGQLKSNWRTTLHVLRSRIFNLQRVSRAFQVGEKHYDIGNDLYQAMLDRRMTYSCGYWKTAKNLDEAQEAKLELICRKLHLEPGMTVLDLGCGWGAFAKYAAEKYNVHVVGVTVSRNQIELGRELCRGLPVEIQLADYRSVSGTYDRVLSVGFFEHVGYRNYRTYMEISNRCLKPDGIACLQTIGRNTSTTTFGRWGEKYIFPNSMLPSIAQIGTAMEGLFVMEDWHNFGPDYDRTLMAWYAKIENAWSTLSDSYDERFRRMWHFYLSSFAGPFRAREVQLWQIVMAKRGRTQPEYRIT